MTDYTKELTERSENLRAELQEMQKGFEMKREEFLKLQGALEMLQVLDKDSKEAEDDDWTLAESSYWCMGRSVNERLIRISYRKNAWQSR